MVFGFGGTRLGAVAVPAPPALALAGAGLTRLRRRPAA
jgi:hypothetical protein